MRWFLADGNQSWLCQATKGRNTRPSFSKLSAEFCSFYFHMKVLIYLSETENIYLFCLLPHNSRKIRSRKSQIIILLFSFQKYFARKIFLDISLQGLMLNRINLVRVEESVQLRLLDQRRVERQEITCGVGFHCLSPDGEPKKINLFCLESYEQDWARGIILLNYIKLAKRVDICDKIASVSSYKML